MGMFHVHFGGTESLSEGDKEYIVRIMEVMPKKNWLSVLSCCCNAGA